MTHDRSPRMRWDALAPPSLLLFFWISDLLVPYVYAVSRHPWERQRDMMGILRVEDMHWALLAAVLYLICWLGGYYWTRWTPKFKLKIREPKRPVPVLRLLFNFAAAFALFVILYAINPNTSFLSRMELTVGPWGKALFLSIGLLFAAFWLSAIGLLSAGRKGSGSSNVILTIMLAFCMIAVFAPLEGRGRMLIAMLYVVVVWHYFVRPLSTLTVWTILGLGSALAVGIDYLRLSAVYSHIDGMEMAYGLAYGRQFDGALNLAATLRGVSLGYVEHHQGAAWLSDVLADLGIRGGHPDSRTMFMTEVLRITRFQAGFPMTRPGELYLAFGWSGVAVGAALIGAFTRVWYNWLMRARALGAASPAVYFTFVMTAGLVTQKNYMFSSLAMALVYIALILLLALFAYGYSLVMRQGRDSTTSLWRRRRNGGRLAFRD
jgi:hypothetical protein